MRFVRCLPEEVDWAKLDAYPDRQIFQTKEWLDFVAEAQGAEVVVAALEDNGSIVGWFSGLVQRRFGLRMLGAPFPGWSTSYLCFNLEPFVPRREAWKALLDFAARELRCVHLEA